ncbi:Uncharacterized protein APZ42_029833 [Daphnia magna]|uniref:ATP-dependent DNA helicase n=1 Tax=Daphnia magna TaxID=35525 RepID=A0A162D454_9CRUS|nr:Uncharacterized protein APZ42_029833 [Daphnia magna]
MLKKQTKIESKERKERKKLQKAREKHLQDNRARAQYVRDEKKQRLDQDVQRQTQDEVDRQVHLDVEAQRRKENRAQEPDKIQQARLQEQALRQQALREEESEEEIRARLKDQATWPQAAREAKTADDRRCTFREELLAARNRVGMPRTHKAACKTLASEDRVLMHDCGEMTVTCGECNARHFKGEQPTDKKFTQCCAKGKVILPPPKEFPQPLVKLLQNDHPKAKAFMTKICNYNSAHAFASLGTNISSPPGRGPYCLRIHGQVYHNTTPVGPNTNNPRYADLYFMDAAQAGEFRALSTSNGGCCRNLMEELDAVLREKNPYAAIYKMMRQVLEEEYRRAQDEKLPHQTVGMIISSDRRNLDQRRYNSPTTNEIAVIFKSANGEPPAKRDIHGHLFITVRGRIFFQIDAQQPMCDPMTYPLLFPNGDDGWHVNMPYTTTTRSEREEAAARAMDVDEEEEIDLPRLNEMLRLEIAPVEALAVKIVNRKGKFCITMVAGHPNFSSGRYCDILTLTLQLPHRCREFHPHFYIQITRDNRKQRGKRAQEDPKAREKRLQDNRARAQYVRDEKKHRLDQEVQRQTPDEVDRQARLEEEAQRRKENRAQEPAEVQQARLQEQALRQQALREEENEDERRARLRDKATRQQATRNAETDDGGRVRMIEDNLRHQVLRAQETEEERSSRVMVDSMRNQVIRAQETVEERTLRAMADRLRHQMYLVEETKEEAEIHRELNREQTVNYRAAEIEEETEERREESQFRMERLQEEREEDEELLRAMNALEHAEIIPLETEEERTFREELLTACNRAGVPRTHRAACKTLPSEDHVLMQDSGEMTVTCGECSARHFKGEQPTDKKFTQCCAKGKAGEFRALSTSNGGCCMNLMEELDAILREKNPYAAIYKMMRQVLEEEYRRAQDENLTHQTVGMIISSDRKNLDQRRYNSPTTKEIAVIFKSANGELPVKRDIRGHLFIPVRGGTFVQIDTQQPMCDPMTYPLLFPNGDDGWHVNMPYTTTTRRHRSGFHGDRVHFVAGRNNLPFAVQDLSSNNRDDTNHALDAINHVFQTLMKNRVDPYGGKVLLLGGDFRQCLPVVRHGNRIKIIEATITNNATWPLFRQLRLVQNMRTADGSQEFADWLIQLGNGSLAQTPRPNDLDLIEIPQGLLSIRTNLIEHVFGDPSDLLNEGVREQVCNRAILCPKNEDCLRINNKIIGEMPGALKVCKSIDTIDSEDPEEISNYPPEILNAFNVSELPPHQLKQKIGAIVILLKNIDSRQGLCNGTRLIIKAISGNLIVAEIAAGKHKGHNVFLPRMSMSPTDSDLSFKLKRLQFPVLVGFAMTINKSQGQTFE